MHSVYAVFVLVVSLLQSKLFSFFDAEVYVLFEIAQNIFLVNKDYKK